MGELDGKRALITGGTTGIGKATAALFRDQGATVTITGQDQERLDATAAELGVAGILADQGSVASLANLAAQVAGSGGVDILVLNAGITAPSPSTSDDEAAFDHQVGINFKGVYFTVAKLAAHLNDGASVIAVTSCLDQLGMEGMGVYAATKAAVRSLVRTWANELRGRNIRVNAVAPGPINTPIYGKLGLPPEDLQAIAAGIQGRVPMNRFGVPEEIAGPMLFLASPFATYITGEEIIVDGGWTNI